MGFWNNLFAKLTGKKAAKFDANAVDGDGDGRIQDGTIWERDASLNAEVIKDVVEDAVDSVLQGTPLPDVQASEEEVKKRKRQEAAKKAAATRAKNKQSKLDKVKADAEAMAERTAKHQGRAYSAKTAEHAKKPAAKKAPAKPATAKKSAPKKTQPKKK